jgi:ParB family chromosome partitioning protein
LTFTFKVIKTDEALSVDKIVSGDIQVRTHDVDAEIEALAEDMKPGLIHPILVYERDDGNYELVAGQRRLLAATKLLNWKTIRATIIEKPADKLTAKMISYIENKARRKLSNKDVVNYVNQLYANHTVAQIAKDLGIGQGEVKRAIDMPRYPKEVRDMVTAGDISLETAKRSVDIYQWEPSNTDDSDEEKKVKEETVPKIIEMAKTMEPEPFANAEQKNAVLEFGQDNPNLSPEEIIKKGKQKELKSIKVKFFNKNITRLDKFAKDKKTSSEEAAGDLILDGLSEAGY